MDIPSSLRSTRAAVVEGLLSYGRSQEFIYGSQLSHRIGSDGDASLGDEEDNEYEDGDDNLTTDSEGPSEIYPQFQGFDIEASVPSISTPRSPSSLPPAFPMNYSSLAASPNSACLNPSGSDLRPAIYTDNSPLLYRSSIHFGNTPKPPSSPSGAPKLSAVLHPSASGSSTVVSRRKSIGSQQLRRRSNTSLRERKGDLSKGSTYGQSLFNSIAVLLGVGILSEPYAFAQAGWVMGTLLIIGYGALACQTAKILGRMIADDHRLRTYADCGMKAFGPRSAALASVSFFVDLFTVSVILVVLYADSIYALFPVYSADTYKLLSLIILIPSAFLPLSVISYTSLLSVIATLFIAVVLVIDGFSKPKAPGSLFEFAPTDLWPNSSVELGLSYGLFMAGFAGHAVVPSIARDMQEPEHFDGMINMAFFVTTGVYLAVGTCGYLMFGRTITDEFSRDLSKTPGYNAALAKIGLWMLVISPIMKFSLTSRPLCVTLESLFNLESPPVSKRARSPGLVHHPSISSILSEPESALLSSNTGSVHKGFSRVPRLLKAPAFLRALERTALTMSIVGVAIAVPQFGTIMSILGAFVAFTLCIIGPLAAKLCIFETSRWERLFDWTLLIISIIMATWGTIAALYK